MKIKSLSAPIRRLHPEIISEIFKYAVHFLPRHALHSVRLSHVCCYWRHLALSTSYLWSFISLRWEVWKQRGLSQHQSMLDHFLGHSGSVPLSLFIDLHGVTDNSPLLRTLAGHAPRWKALSLYVRGDWSYILPLFRITDPSLPLLEKVELKCNHNFIHNFNPKSGPLGEITCFRAAPKLTSITLGFGWKLDTVALPWSQLTNLAVGTSGAPIHASMFRIVDVLRQCPELVNLELVARQDEERDEGMADQVQDRIVLNQLQSLTVSNAPMEAFIFRHLVVPNLHHFTFTPYRDHRSPPYSFTSYLDAFESFLTRSRCTITTATLSSRYVTYGDITRLFERLSDLQDVRIHLSHSYDESQKSFIESLGGFEEEWLIPFDHCSTSCLFPSLKRITIHGLQASPGLVDALVSVIRYRCGFVEGGVESPRVRLAFAFFDETIVSALAPHLQDCIASGLHLYSL
ncbi:hypothetical protein JAAARDRAFT_528865 [Jaapia argillacea MUCL 33604]|uniref:Uncharacterized protein n=1 Tax=Jaapia argillacea MUCL 33604 TaxID=933084 RepID=A0A067Q4U7_9AGAM|nr:hypothetical protein JAAARDRAFT_528865 [Jaapia argillacea MUCL 33604]